MGVTAANVLVGIGDFEIDSTSVGSTRGGVTITKTIEIFEKIVDQAFSPVGLAKVSEAYRVSTEIAEATLQNMKTIWDVPNSVETAGSLRTLSLGIDEDVNYHSLTFYGKSPEGYNRKFHVYKAIIAEVGDTVLMKDDLTVYPVTFGVYPDTDKPAGKQLGYVEDTIST